MNDIRGSKRRLTVLMLFCMCSATAVLVRAAYIQLLKNPRLEAIARRQFQSHALVRPRRGAILDRNQEPLAINLETNSLAANTAKIQNKRQVARHLSHSLGIPYSKLIQKFSEPREFIWIKRHLSETEMKNFKKWRIVDSDGDFVDGLWLVKESERVYPHGHLASHILGNVNVDSEGLEGIELWMNDQLRGKVASVDAIKDALGRPTFIDAVAAKNVQDGEPVTLTLDASLQFEVEQQLKAAVQKTGAKSGTVIVMNSSTGEILAMANEPSFNANDKTAPSERRRNRAITDGFEPGSTLKPILVASALSHGWKMSDQVWGEKGSFTLQNHKISEAETHEKFEWVSLKKMIQVSSNIAAAKIALKLGADRYTKTLRLFGFGSKTGVAFPGEISGRIPGKKELGPLTLANVGFGQGVLTTPIQMVRAYAAIQNGGLLVKPTLLKKSGTVIREQPVRVFSEKISQSLIEALETVTQEGGTGTKAAVPGYRIAGKTGTAQMVDPKTGKYSREKYNSSFIGFPAGVEPKIVVFASLSELKGVYYASQTAAPLFKEVFSSAANRCSLPIRIDTPKVLAEQSFRDNLKLSQSAPNSIAEVQTLQQAELGQEDSHFVMPILKGLTPRETFGILKGHRFQIEIHGKGIVSNQSPEPGKRIAEGDSIRLILTEP